MKQPSVLVDLWLVMAGGPLAAHQFHSKKLLSLLSISCCSPHLPLFTRFTRKAKLREAEMQITLELSLL